MATVSTCKSLNNYCSLLWMGMGWHRCRMRMGSPVSAARQGSLHSRNPTQFRKDRGNMKAIAEVEQDSTLRHVAKEGGLLSAQ